MLCPFCSAENPNDAGFCRSCRQTIAPGTGIQTPSVPSPYAQTPSWGSQYYDRPIYAPPAYMFAGFWPRAGAWLLDGLFAGLLAIIPAVIAGSALALAVSAGQDEPRTVFEEDQQNEDIVVAGFVGGAVVFYLGTLIYFTVANAKGGGWGKRIVGLRILRQRDGQLPQYGTGFMRAIAPVLFGLIPFFGSVVQLLDYLWCIWDAQKQTWHDKVAGTVVVVVS
jgi:uncharacterized RDD family membrane protein YckC